MRESDLALVLQWRNRDDVRHNMYTNAIISMETHIGWWQRESVNSASHLLIADVDGTAAGVVNFTHYTGEGGTASWAFYSGDRKVRGIGSLMEVAALEYAFEVLKVRRLECEVLAFNYPVVRFHRKFGFKVEGIKQQAYYRDGECYDIYSLAMLAEHWRFNQNVAKAKTVNKIPKSISKTVFISDEMVVKFADLSDDHNPLHFDDEEAKMHGFDGRICHGMLASSLFSGLFASSDFGAGTIYLSQSLKFIRPININSEVTVTGRLLSQIGRKVILETTILSGEQVCIRGEAEILLASESTNKLTKEAV